jgi:hypothetical protein
MARIITGVQTGGDVMGIDAVIKVLSAGEGSTENENKETRKAPDKTVNLVRLKECAARLSKINHFTNGQLVQWKEGLKNKATPAYGQPVIVVDVLKKPVFDFGENSDGSQYINEPLTLVAGIIAENGDFLCYHFDGRRFEPYVRAENEEE